MRVAGAVFWAAYVATFLPEIIGAFFQKARAADQKKDKWSRSVIHVGLVVGLFAAFIVGANWHAGQILANDDAAEFAGAALMLCGIAFRWYAIRVLGRFFTRDVAIRQGHRIIRAGPYRYIRHPSYAGWYIASLGIGLGINNWASLLILMVTNVLVYGYRMNVEEAALEQAFGDEYRSYRSETKRLIPGVY